MIIKDREKLTLHQPVTYKVKVPGELDVKWLDWYEGMKVSTECDGNNDPITTLTIKVDQAGLHGLLSHLYSLGVPLISVLCIDFKGK